MLSAYGSFQSLVQRTADSEDIKDSLWCNQEPENMHVRSWVLTFAKWFWMISAPSQSGTTCNISLKFKDNIRLIVRQQPASMQSSLTLKRLNHNAEIQTFTRHVSIKDETQI